MKAIDSKIEEAQIIEGLRSRQEKLQNEAIKMLYSDIWMNLAKKAVISVGGNKEDTEDIFQESLAALVKNVMNGNFRGASKMSTYFFEICRRKTMSTLKMGYNAELVESNLAETSPSLEVSMMNQERKEELRSIVADLLGQLGEPCASILKFRNLNYSYEEIADILAYDNPDTAKNQAGRCRKRLRESITAKPDVFKKIKTLR